MAQAVVALALIAGCGSTQTASNAPDAAPDAAASDASDATPGLHIEGGTGLDAGTVPPGPEAGTPIADAGACVQQPEADCATGPESAVAQAWQACSTGCPGPCGAFAVRFDGQGCATAFGTPYPGSDFESCIVKELAAKRWSCAAGSLVSVSIACTAPPC